MSKLKKHLEVKTRSWWNLAICDNFYRIKITTAEIRFCNDRLSSRTDERNKNEHQDDLSSHTMSWTKKKKFYHKKSHQGWTQKKRHTSENKVQNQKLSTLMNRHHIHNAFTTLKSVAVFFRDVITEETTSSQDQKLLETTNLWRQLFSDKNSPQCNFASAKIAWMEQQWTSTWLN